MGGSIRLRKAEVTRYVTKLREHPCTSTSGRNGLVWDRTAYGCMYVTKGTNGLVWDRTTYGCMYITKGTIGLVWDRTKTARFVTKQQKRLGVEQNGRNG